MLAFLEEARRSGTAPQPTPGFAADVEAFCSKVVQLLMLEARAREVAILTVGSPSFEIDERESTSNITEWHLKIRLPPRYYSQMSEEQRRSCATAITRAAQTLDREGHDDWIRGTIIQVDVKARENWREHAIQWLRGEGINNQGRVRSDNMPSRQEDGLLFRSLPEVLLYRALKSAGVAFAPLPVFLRGGSDYQRLEPDFVVLKANAIMVVEVDGDTVHVETPAEADQRTRIFKHEGALIERVRASDCDTPEKAAACATKLLAGFDKWRDPR